MKRILLCIFICLFSIGLVRGEEITDVSFTWKYTAEEELKIDGYRIWNNGLVLMDNIIPSARDITITYHPPGVNNDFHITAFKNATDTQLAIESDDSVHVKWKYYAKTKITKINKIGET